MTKQKRTCGDHLKKKKTKSMMVSFEYVFVLKVDMAFKSSTHEQTGWVVDNYLCITCAYREEHSLLGTKT